jgi:hypothetical protein
MNSVETALNIVNLINAATPGVAQLILLIRNSDNTVSIGTILDQADAQFDANIKQIEEWMKSRKV